MFSSLLCKFKVGSDYGVSRSNAPNDREQDGFVLVGETLSDRSAVTKPISGDNPPLYSCLAPPTVNHGITYNHRQDYHDDPYKFSSDNVFLGNSTPEPSTESQQQLLNDIPFELSSSLLCHESIEKLSADVTSCVEQFFSRINHNYSCDRTYDFSLERNFLKEFEQQNN